MKKSQHFGYYDKTHTNEQAAQLKYHEKFAQLLDLEPDMKVLDAGCGQGVVACYLAKNCGVEVTGITIVPYEVKSAKKMAKRNGVEEYTNFILADYASSPFKLESFDRIYTTESLSHAVDVKAVLEEFMKLLKRDGKLVCAEYEVDHAKFEEAQKASATVKKYAAIHGVYQFEPGQFVKNLESVGFKSIKVLDWTKNIMPSFERIARLAKHLTPIVRKLHLERYLINIAVADLYAEGVRRKAFSYKVYTAVKNK